MNILNENIRFPNKGDKFFIEEGHPDEISCLHKTFQDFGSYADSYQTGALNLIDDALENKVLRDYHIYPIVFLIRHYLELRLKELIQGLYYCKEHNRDFPTHHDIKTLWGEFKKAYASIGENEKNESFKVIDELINEMYNVDPISMAFRYPIDKAGTKIQKLEYVNLKNIKEVFIRVCFVFDGVAMQIDHYTEITEDMMRDVYENYW
jgi:hypothetical protein